MALETGTYNYWQTCRRAGQLAVLALFLIVAPLAQATWYKPSTWFCDWNLTGRKAPSERQSDQQIVSEMIARNDFQILRSYDDYYESFGDGFFLMLAHLGDNDYWVDMGAGSAKAQVDVIEGTMKRSRHPKMVAVSMAKPSSKNITVVDRAYSFIDYIRAISKMEYHISGGRLKYVEGDVTKIPTSKIAPVGKVKLITDVFGPMSYASDLTRVLEVYGKLLEPGGEAYLVLNNDRLKVRDPVGQRLMKLTDFIRFYCEGFDTKHLSGYEVLIRNEKPLYIPPVELFELSLPTNPPPTRYFKVIGFD